MPTSAKTAATPTLAEALASAGFTVIIETPEGVLVRVPDGEKDPIGAVARQCAAAGVNPQCLRQDNNITGTLCIITLPTPPRKD